jgi:hypothetical protein
MNLQRKIKKNLSLYRLIENEESSVPNTLTDKEVFIITYLLEDVDRSVLYSAERYWDELNPYDMKKIIDTIFTPILPYVNQKGLKNDLRLYQYIFCALENETDTSVSTDTPIRRMKNYDYKIWETRRQIEYVDWRTEIPGFSLDEVRNKSKLIQESFWHWGPESNNSDYGDSESLGLEDEEIRDSIYEKFLVID